MQASDPVFHPELAPETNSTLTSGALHKRRRFHNLLDNPKATGNFRDLWGYIFRQAFRRVPTEWPRHHTVPPEVATQLLESSGVHSITWLGHATFVLYLGGRRIVIDHFLTNRASPLSFTGLRRFIPLPPGIQELGPIERW